MILHGGDVYSHPVSLDFSANINPLGLPQGVRAALTENIDKYAQYPDPQCRELRRAIAEQENAPFSQIVCGNGASDLIDRMVRTFRPKRALLAVPTFTEYERALRSMGCAVRFFPLSEAQNFQLNETFCNMLHDVDMVFLCNPNNPTGTLISPALMRRICEKCIAENMILVIDECFLTLTAKEEESHVVPWDSHLFVLRAFTKTYALAGLRLGYLLCGDQNSADAVSACGPCWGVSVPAQIAGLAALKEKEYLRISQKMIQEERHFLENHLRQLGLRVFPSSANFLLFFCARPLDHLLREHGISIRNCDNFIGLSEGYFRVAVRSHEENLALLQAIGEGL